MLVAGFPSSWHCSDHSRQCVIAGLFQLRMKKSQHARHHCCLHSSSGWCHLSRQFAAAAPGLRHQILALCITHPKQCLG